MKIALVVLLLCSFCFADDKPDPAKFTIDIHVTGSVLRGNELLNAYIDGKKAVLSSMDSCESVGIGRVICALLPPGNYKARVNRQKTSKKGRVVIVYSILMADGWSTDYHVVGLGDTSF